MNNNLIMKIISSLIAILISLGIEANVKHVPIVRFKVISRLLDDCLTYIRMDLLKSHDEHKKKGVDLLE